MDPNLLSKENKDKKLFRSFLGEAKDMMPPSWALGGHGRVAPPPPGSASGSEEGQKAAVCKVVSRYRVLHPSE